MSENKSEFATLLERVQAGEASVQDFARLSALSKAAEEQAESERMSEFRTQVTEVASGVVELGDHFDYDNAVGAGYRLSKPIHVEIGGVTYAVNITLTDLKRKAEKRLAQAEQEAKAS